MGFDAPRTMLLLAKDLVCFITATQVRLFPLLLMIPPNRLHPDEALIAYMIFWWARNGFDTVTPS